MKNIVLYVFLLTLNIGYSQCKSYAAQLYTLPDKLLWENDTIQIQTFPLKCWFKFDQELLFNKKVKPECWGCLKNYKAEWKIINNKLYLSNIYSFNFKKDSIKSDLHTLFPDKIKDNMVLADWYSGNLYVPKGDHIWLGQSPGFPIYESEWKLIFKNGKLKKKVLNTSNYYKSIYTENPKRLSQFIEDRLDEKWRKKLKNKRIYIIIRTGSSRKNFKVSIERLHDKSLKKELIAILNSLPEFDYYYRHGEKLNQIFSFHLRYPLKTKE